MKKHFKPTLR